MATDELVAAITAIADCIDCNSRRASPIDVFDRLQMLSQRVGELSALKRNDPNKGQDREILRGMSDKTKSCQLFTSVMTRMCCIFQSEPQQ